MNSASLLALCFLTAAASAQGLQQVGAINVTSAFGLRGPFVVDFDGNGQVDLVHQDLGLGQVRLVRDVSLTTTAATSTSLIDLSTLPGVGRGTLTELLEVGDIDADGFPDLLLARTGSFFNQDLTVFLVRGTGGGAVAAPVAIIGPTPMYRGATAAVLADFDGDGDTDIAFSMGPPVATLNAATEIWLQDPSAPTGFSLGITYPVAFGTGGGVSAGDFNGDGLADVVFAEVAGAVALLGSRTGLGSVMQAPLPPGGVFGFAGIGDVNGDGRDDLFNPGAYGSSPARVLLANATGSFDIGQSFMVPSARYFDIGEGLDFDVDGNGDLIVFSVSPSPELLVYRGDGLGNFSTSPLTLALPEFGLGFGDLDADDDPDIFVTDRNSTITLYENRSFFGGACAGAGPAPRLEVGAGLPGNAAFSIDLRGAAPGMPFEILMAFGQAPMAPAGCGFQVDLSKILLPSGVVPFFSQRTDMQGSASLALPLPMSVPTGPLFFQAVVMDPAGTLGVGPLRFSATRGRAIQFF